MAVVASDGTSEMLRYLYEHKPAGVERAMLHSVAMSRSPDGFTIEAITR